MKKHKHRWLYMRDYKGGVRFCAGCEKEERQKVLRFGRFGIWVYR